MDTRKTRWLFLIAVLGLVAGGCSRDEGDGIKPEAKQELTDANATAKKADGDFDKLSAADKQKFVGLANGNEAAARQLVKNMAHPPNEAAIRKGSGGRN